MLGPKRDKLPPNRLQQLCAGQLPDYAIDVAWSGDGTQIAAAAVSGPIHILEPNSNNVQLKLVGHGFGTTAIAFHPKQQLLASVGQDGKVRVWDTITGAEQSVQQGGAAWVERVAWSTDGKYLATAAGKIVRIWDGTTFEMLREYTGHAATIADIAWQKGKPILAVVAYGGIHIYDPEQPDALHHWEWKGSPLNVAWAPNGKMLAHGNQDSTVHFWYAATGEDLHMSGYSAKVRAISWEFSSRTLATSGSDSVCIWDCSGKGPAGSTPKMLAGHEATITALAYQHSGFLLASGDEAGRFCIWQPANRTPMIGAATFEDTEITALAWSPDDKLVFVGTAFGATAVFRVK